MLEWLKDLRYSARQLRRSPAFTAVAVATLGLGIGVQAIVFELVDAAVFKPVSALHLDDVYSILPVQRKGYTLMDAPYVALDDFRAFNRARPASIVGAYGMVRQTAVFQSHRAAETLYCEAITSDYSRVLGLGTMRGRWLSDSDSVASVVISDRIWRNWFGASPDVIGQAPIKMGRQSLTIVGIAPAGFRGLVGHSDIWLPVEAAHALLPQDSQRQWLIDHGDPGVSVQVIVKSRPGTPAEEIEASVLAALRGTPSGNRANRVMAHPLADGTRFGMFHRLGWVILGVSSCILLAACANLANLLYARGMQRAAEIAVRVSLGANRWRIGRLFLMEATIISIAGALTGFLLAFAGLTAFSARLPSLRLDKYSPITISLAPDERVLGFTFAAGLFAAIAVGVTTAWRMTRVPPLRMLASGGAAQGMTARSSGLRTGLVAVQVTAAVVLVMAASFFLENFTGGLNKQLLFDTGHVVSTRLDLGRVGYTNDRASAFLAKLVTDLRAQPGIVGAAYVDSVPSGTGESHPTAVTLTPESVRPGESVAARAVTAAYSAVSPGSLHTLDIALQRGRDFTSGDQKGELNVAIVSEGAATVMWPGQDPIGKRVLFGVKVWLTVVGVAADPVTGPSERQQDGGRETYDVRTQPSNFIFVPFDQWRTHEKALVLMRSPAPDRDADVMRDAIRRLDEDVPALEMGTLQESMFAWYGAQRTARILSSTLAVLALAIAMLGIYGVVGYFVSIRMREFGVRLALGASRARVLKLVIDHAIHIILIGLLPAVFIVSAGSRVVPLVPSDIPTWFAVPAIVMLAGVLAAMVPALRAARLDPAAALKDS